MKRYSHPTWTRRKPLFPALDALDDLPKLNQESGRMGDLAYRFAKVGKDAAMSDAQN